MENNVQAKPVVLKKKSRLLRFSRVIHKWPALVISFLALIFAFSGIILNHRDLLSSIDVPRKILPSNYRYENWNLAAMRGSLTLSDDSVLLYGNIGVWMTNGKAHTFTDFNQGFPKGIDQRKIYTLASFKGKLVAATHFGLYTRDTFAEPWQKRDLPVNEERVTDLAVKGDTLVVLTRHHLLKTSDLRAFEPHKLPAPIGYDKKIGLFTTLWELHSGELFGLAGKLFVDLLGIVTILLSVTGIIHFFIPGIIKRRKANRDKVKKLASTAKTNIRWHNVVGYIFILFLIINVTAGMFLRPPFLIAIANSKVAVLPHSHLDDNNPWHDKLRRITWNDSLKIYLISTSEGFHVINESLNHPMVPVTPQPPVSVMGCNVLQQIDRSTYLVGSFNGLFVWNLESGFMADHFTGMPVNHSMYSGRPIGNQMVTGVVNLPDGKSWWFGYDVGATGLNHTLPFKAMPEEVHRKSPLSLWNLALEMHTGRIFEFLLGPFYILIVPLTALSLILVLLSGFIIWWKSYRKR